MWVARDKDGTLNLWFNKPKRAVNFWYGQQKQDGWKAIEEFIQNKHEIDGKQFPKLTWDDEPIEVMVVSLEELRKGQIDYKTKQIESLTRVFRGVALEDVVNILNDLEEKIHSKYKMKGNPYCTQNCRMVTIPHSSIQLGDNSLREYIVYGKVAVTMKRF